MNIPTPPAGHWAKVKAGKSVTKIPLPVINGHQTKEGLRTDSGYSESNSQDSLSFLCDEDKAKILAVVENITKPSDDEIMHKKIVAYRKALSSKKSADTYQSRNNYYQNKPEPNIVEKISEKTQPRVFHIIDALIKTLEPLGCSLTDNLNFLINGEKVPYSFSEAQDEIKHELTKDENMQLLKYQDEKRRSSWVSKPQIRKYDNVHNGRINILINKGKRIRDCNSYIVEDKLGDIIIEFYRASNEIRIEREAREEEARKRKEAEDRRENARTEYNREVVRTKELCSMAEDYEMACKIRAYITAYENAHEKSDITEEHIKWAKSKADWLDPTVALSDNYFGKRAHKKDRKEKEIRELSSWEWRY